MHKVYIMGACRTPIGKMGGALSSLSAIDLGALVIREAIERSGISADEVDHVYMGCVLQAGLGQNIARQAAIRAGLPYKVTAETLNIVCGSGLDAINTAARLIQTGTVDVVIAGGTESMSNAPFALKNARFGYRMGSPMLDTPLVDTMVNDALWDAINDYHMGITAENIAEKYGLTRDELDEFAVISQRKAAIAISQGKFKDEIISITVKNKKGDIIVDTDEAPRPDVTVEDLAKLKAVFKPDGIVTAGNSSGINDGAAAMVLVSEKKIKELNLHPQVEWIDGALGGVDPAVMGIGPVESTKKLMNKLSMQIEDIDLIEANEAFASQSIAVQRELLLPQNKVNIHGGAIALGHPVGASGARIMVTLIHELKPGQKGMATLCIGGGMGCSTLIKRCEK
ncbi:thiolase family protein [Selenomonas ruminis]|uniref:acetyl-CoA C-acetyltransferase n=1 Tax=Selenomonas ruminis TaxID=2593411 RepID=A0A5D6WAM8_9FIRM|nr:acetyl-CoA C-acetyltransferase [Selenomonas sp. mPRGC5]TYZ24512.1 acetyl-CoA C-acetyltransferase [Selenomonas sp. mPRGC5]